MEVSIENLGKLERVANIAIPAEVVSVEFEKRLNEVKDTIRLDGFRPGKVPQALVRKRFGDSIYNEIAEQQIQKSFTQTLEQENLRLARSPDVKPKTLENGKPIEYTATFEILPEFELKPLTDVTVEKWVTTLTEEEIQVEIDNVLKLRADWHEVERPAQLGDRTNVDFYSTIDDEEFPGGSATDVNVTLGSGHMLEDLETSLIGKSAGDKYKLNLRFPDDYRDVEIAGKEAVFDIEVSRVDEIDIPELDEDFIKTFGVESGSIDDFKEKIQSQLQARFDQKASQHIREQLVEKITEQYDFDVPQVFVERETEAQRAMKERELPEGKTLSEDEIRECAESSEKKVRLSLIFSEVTEKNKFTIGPDDLSAENLNEIGISLQAIAQMFSGHGGVDMGDVQNLILEQKAINYLSEQATQVEKNVAYGEVVNS